MIRKTPRPRVCAWRQFQVYILLRSHCWRGRAHRGSPLGEILSCCGSVSAQRRKRASLVLCPLTLSPTAGYHFATALNRRSTANTGAAIFESPFNSIRIRLAVGVRTSDTPSTEKISMRSRRTGISTAASPVPATAHTTHTCPSSGVEPSGWRKTATCPRITVMLVTASTMGNGLGSAVT